MGILDKISKKIGDSMEKAAASNMTGESKELYEKEKKEREEKAKEFAEFKSQSVSTPASAEEMKDLNALLAKAKAVDSDNLWLAGFPNFKTNQNAKVANLFSGKKNLKIITKCNDVFFLLRFEDGNLKSYDVFNKSMVKEVGSEAKLFSKTFKVKLGSHLFTIEVTDNKDKIKQMVDALK